MNDRELLELAAKAAGFGGKDCKFCWTESQYPRHSGQNGALWNYIGHGDSAVLWNPLTDDGDALRLAVKLNLHAMRSSENRVVCYEEDSVNNNNWRVAAECWFPSAPTSNAISDIDQLSATRRAIVRAAAEIGRAMP